MTHENKRIITLVTFVLCKQKLVFLDYISGEHNLYFWIHEVRILGKKCIDSSNGC